MGNHENPGFFSIETKKRKRPEMMSGPDPA
jgi:hypothetical protein